MTRWARGRPGLPFAVAGSTIVYRLIAIANTIANIALLILCSKKSHVFLIDSAEWHGVPIHEEN